MTVPELSLRAVQARPAHRSVAPAPSATWLDEAAPVTDESPAVAHVAPAHTGATHLTPWARLDSRVGIDIAFMLVRGAVIGALLALLYVALAGGWIGMGAEALSTWWAGDIAPYFAIDIVPDAGDAGGVPASAG